MKIVYVLWDTIISGGTRVVFEFANNLKNLGHKVTIVTLGPERNAKWFNLKVPLIAQEKPIPYYLTRGFNLFAAKTGSATVSIYQICLPNQFLIVMCRLLLFV